LIRSASQAEGTLRGRERHTDREVQVMEEDHAFHQTVRLPRLQEIRVWDDERGAQLPVGRSSRGLGLCARETAAFTGRSAPKQRPLVKSRAANIQQNTVA
jgi:hypothetical protein